MAEVQAGQQEGHDQQQQQQQQQGQDDQQQGRQDQQQQQGRTYSQEELDRIANRIRRNARREARLEAERDFLAQQRSQPQGEHREEKKDEDAEPKRDDFDTFEEHQRAVARWEGRKAAREENQKVEKEAREKTQREEAQKAEQTWRGKINRAVEKIEDFEDVLEASGETFDKINRNPMRVAVLESDIGPEIVYHLCKNPAEVERISKLPAYKQAAEIAKIEEKLAPPSKGALEGEHKGTDEDADGDDDKGEEATPRDRNDDGTFKGQKKETPKVDEPINPVGPRSGSSSSEPSDKDSAEVWHRKRVAQIERRRNPGKR